MKIVKNMKLAFCGLALLALASPALAQDSTQVTPAATEKPKAGKTTLFAQWIFGIHGVVVDDDGEIMTDLFNVSDSWNFLPYPTRITGETWINPIWRVEASAAYSKIKAGNVANDVVVQSDQPFFAFDLNAKYDLNDLFGRTSVFDPYTVSGLGFTHRSSITDKGKNTPTVNLGLGFNIWIYEGWGVNLQTTAKIKLNMESSNYLMHTFGVIYRLGPESRNDATRGTESAIRQQM